MMIQSILLEYSSRYTPSNSQFILQFPVFYDEYANLGSQLKSNKPVRGTMSVPFTRAKIPSRWRLSFRAFRASPHTRNYAVQAPGRPTLQVFNRAVKHMQKDRAARKVEQSRQVDYIKDEVAKRLCERLLVRPPTPYLVDLSVYANVASTVFNRISKGPFRMPLISVQIVAILPEL